MRKDLVDKYKFDPQTIIKPEDETAFLDLIKKNEPDVTPLLPKNLFSFDNYYNYLGWDLIIDSIAIKADDQNLKTFDGYNTPEFKQAADLAYKWSQAGYFPTDPSTDPVTDCKAGKYAAYRPTEIYKPGGDAEAKAQLGYDIDIRQIGKPLLTTAGTIATMNGIWRTSANPERAVMFLELLNSDKDLYNLLAKGIEGNHYTFVDKAKGFIYLVKDSGYNPNTDWMFGNQFNAYYTDPNAVGSWEATKKLNDTAAVSQALGFSFNPENVKTEIAQVEAVIRENAGPITIGQVDPATAIPQLLSKLKEAGNDGGAIYTGGNIGNGTNSIISNNYLYGDYKNYGVIYLDLNSQHISVNNNVVENTSTNWIYIQTCCGQSSINNDIEYNYTDSSTTSAYDSSNTVANNQVGLTSWPSQALDIINNAGLEYDYQYLKYGNNLLGNGGFESGSLDQWGTYDGGVVNNNARSGVISLPIIISLFRR